MFGFAQLAVPKPTSFPGSRRGCAKTWVVEEWEGAGALSLPPIPLSFTRLLAPHERNHHHLLLSRDPVSRRMGEKWILRKEIPFFLDNPPLWSWPQIIASLTRWNNHSHQPFPTSSKTFTPRWQKHSYGKHIFSFLRIITCDVHVFDLIFDIFLSSFEDITNVLNLFAQTDGTKLDCERN